MGHILSKEGIQVDPKKIQSIVKVKTPVNLKETSRFVGKIKWHNRNLRYLSDICSPVSHLTKKGIDFLWSDAQEKAF